MLQHHLSGATPEEVFWRANRGASWLVWSLCRSERYHGFSAVYAWFRWLDDELDRPGVDREEGLLILDRADAPGDRSRMTPEAAKVWAWREAALGRHPEVGTVVKAMTTALRAEVSTRGRARTATELDAHCTAIGDAYLLALWWAAEGDGDVPGELFWLARAATGAHLLRDLAEDGALGRSPVPEGIGPDGIVAWRQSRAAELVGWFARGRAALGGVRPWRAWALLWAYAFKYERLARRFA